MASKKGKNNTPNNGFILKGKIDYSIFLVVLILLISGLIILISASGPISINETGKSYSYVKKQVAYIIIGFGGMFLASKINYKFFKNHMILMYIIYAFVVAGLIYVGLFGKEVNRARRWVVIGGGTFQPSEFAKIALIVFYAVFLTKVYEAKNIKKFSHGFVVPLLLFAPIGYAVYILQNHFSCTFFMGFVLCVQMFVAGSRLSYFGGGMGIAGAAYYIYSKYISNGKGFRQGRLDTWLHFDQADTKAGAYQINQSLYAVASGSLLGVGAGQSIQKYSYLPYAHNDFIFAIFAEEFGFVGCTAIILAFTIFVWRGLVVALKADDMSGKLIAIGITVLIGIEAAMHIAVVTNLGPVTGVLLPFFSFGGSGMIANLTGVGFLLAVSRNSRIKERKEDDK